MAVAEVVAGAIERDADHTLGDAVLGGDGHDVCVVMLVRLGLGVRARMRFDDVVRTVARSPIMLVHRIRAARGAAEAIRRAKSAGEWEGNVYTPKSFCKRPRKPH